MKLGVCYYPEHWPTARWPIDAKLMREAGLSIVRLAEFAWQRMEPEEGEFTWAWLDNAIEILAAEGLQIVLGTPTATPPAWLCYEYPDILPVDSQGRRRRFGSRRHYCSTSLTYRRHTERIVTAMAARYGQHPAIIGWQIDNEFGCHDTARCYCDECAAAFRVWLSKKYQTLDALNEAWGAVFWSQTYSDWGQIAPPNLTITEPNPSHVLDYYHFSSDTVVTYQQLQLSLLKLRIAPSQFITTNFMGNFPDLDYHALAQPLDFVTWDSYPAGYAEVQAETLYAPGDLRPALAYDAGDPYVTGFCHDLTRGLKPHRPFWVMEQQCGNVNWSLTNTGVQPGTVRLWSWHALASGAEAVVYFRWRACLLAQEQNHSGLLHHDASPDVGYQDVLAMRAEHSLMADIAATPHTASVALLLSYADLWALQLQPHRHGFGHLRHLFVYYQALQRLGLSVDIISPEANLSAYKIVIAPTAFLSQPQLADALTQFVVQGGSVLLGIRSGFKTSTNRVTDHPLPGVFRDLVGAQVTAWQAIPPGVAFDQHSSLPALTGPAEFWAESLLPNKDHPTEVLARYTTGPFTGEAALTENLIGSGRALYLGWYPTLLQAEAIVTDLATQAGLAPLTVLPPGLIAKQRGPFTLLLNFTNTEQHVLMNAERISVPARDVRVISRAR